MSEACEHCGHGLPEHAGRQCECGCYWPFPWPSESAPRYTDPIDKISSPTELLGALKTLSQQWRDHEVDVWIECDCARCTYQTCAEQLEALISRIGY